MDSPDGQSEINVLYVDDEPILLETSKLFLEHLGGISVTTAQSASEALKMLENAEYDAIISDYQMPEMDGLDFLRTVRGSGSEIPFIIFTGKGREEVVIEALNAGADFYLQKGGDPNSQFTELLSKVRQAVRRRSAEKELQESEEHYRLLVDNAMSAIVVHDIVFDDDGIPIDYIFLSANQAYEKFTGLKVAEIIGSRATEVMPDFEKTLTFEKYKEAIRTGKPVSFERYSEYYNRYYSFNAYRLSENRFVTVFNDITDLKKNEIELIHKNEELYAAYEQIAAAEEELRQNYEELEQSQIQLRESESWYRTLAETSPDQIFIIDKDDVLKYVNTSALSMFHLAEDEVIGKPRKELFPPDIISAEETDIQKVFNTGEHVRKEELIRFGEDETWIDTRLVPLKDDKGNIYAVLGLARDITERMQAETALRENEEKFRSIFNTQLNGVVIIDPDTHAICDINYAALSMFGAGRNDVIGKICHKFICPTEVGKCPITDLGRTIDHAERQMINAKGDFIDICKSVSHVPIGGKQYLVESFIDITGRKNMEEALRKSENQLKDAMDLAKLVNWEYDIATDTLTFDDRFYALYGTNKEREGGTQMSSERYAMEFVHPDDMHYVADEVKKANEAAIPGFLSNLEHRIIRRDGEIRHIVVRIRVEQDENGRNIKTYGANQDITDRKIAEDAVYEANKKLNILNSVTRHDIINQILALNILLDLVKKKTTDKDIIENITNAEYATGNIYRQIEFTKEYQDIGVEAPCWQNPSDLIAHAKSQFDNYPYEIENNLGSVEIFADPLIEKVFYNLLDNVERHGEKAKKVCLSGRENGDNYILVCEDDGAGIDPEMKKNLFKSGHGKNTGYGLYLIREILSITGITIEETGEPGKGARFEMNVPKSSFRYT